MNTRRPSNVIDILEYLGTRRPAAPPPEACTACEAVELLRTVAKPAVRGMDAILEACETEDDAVLGAKAREVARKWATYTVELALARETQPNG